MRLRYRLRILSIAALLTLAPLASAGAAGGESEFPLKGLEAGKLYAVTVSVDSPYRLSGAAEIDTSISDSRGVIAAKILHPGDLDFYLTLKPRASGNGVVRLNRRSGARDVPVTVDCKPMALSGNHKAAIAALPNSSWQEAQEFELGQTIFGANDERAFVPAPSEDRYQALVKGFQWFKFTYKGASPRLYYFTLDVLDREVSLDIEVFQIVKDPSTGKEDVAPAKEGQFVYLPEATQNFP